MIKKTVLHLSRFHRKGKKTEREKERKKKHEFWPGIRWGEHELLYKTIKIMSSSPNFVRGGGGHNVPLLFPHPTSQGLILVLCALCLQSLI